MKLFVKRDLDGFAGLFVDNLIQLLVIVFFCQVMLNMTGDNGFYLTDLVLPGAALSILFGNLFYAWQAHRLARGTGRDDVTALPYGINTPTVFVFFYFVMLPEYLKTNSISAAWQAGVLACLGSGVIEFLGGFVANLIRKNTPRAALLSTLGGIAMVFIAMDFAPKIWAQPLIGLVPLVLLFFGYFGKMRFPLGFPAGLLAVLTGAGLAWLFYSLDISNPAGLSVTKVVESAGHMKWSYPHWAFDYFPPEFSNGQFSEKLVHFLPYLSVIIPMGLFNVVGSLQNIESAEAAGDSYPAGPSLMVNGLGTILAGLLGSCFPTTIYIGHPGWKEMGARASYSTMNGIVVALMCLSGAIGVVASVIPTVAGAPIIFWIAIIMVSQSFSATPLRHFPAVAMGLFPPIASFGLTKMSQILNIQGSGTSVTFQKLVEPLSAGFTPDPEQTVQITSDLSYLTHGLIVMDQGLILTCMIISAVVAFIIDRRFISAMGWLIAAAVLTGLGIMHAYAVSGNSISYLLIGMSAPASATVYKAYAIASGYLMAAGCCLLAYFWAKKIDLTPILDEQVDSNGDKTDDEATRATQAPTKS